MKAYKDFDKDLKCRGFQYEIGKEYEEKEAIACEKGFHACENPLDVFVYYPLCNGSRYCEVEQSGELSKHDADSKIASTKIKIGTELGLKGIIQAGVSFILDKVNWKNDVTPNTANFSVAENTASFSVSANLGVQSAATNIGYCSTAANTGFWSAAMNTGNLSTAMNIDDQSVSVAAGSRSTSISTGFQSVALTSGNKSVALGSGNQLTALSSGDLSAAAVTNRDSVAIATGCMSKARAGLGSAIVLVERGDWNGKTHPLKNIKAAIVDGEKIKADTWYMLKNGKFVEV